MEEINNLRKRQADPHFDLDFNDILDKTDDEPPQIQIVEPSAMAADEHILSLSDHQLQQRIQGQQNILKNKKLRLTDGGEKSRNTLKQLLEEQKRRESARPEKDADPCSNHMQLTNSYRTDGCKRENGFSEVKTQSDFASCFTRKIEENEGRRAYGEEISLLGSRKDRIVKSRGATFQNRRKKDQLSSRQSPFRCATSLSKNGGKHGTSNGDLRGRLCSTSFHQNGGSSFSNLMKKKDNGEALHLNGSRPRKRQTIVLEDEDDAQFVKTERENRIRQSMKDTKIYYPSRDDPELVEICYSNMKCLDPEGFLTSEIMNFYIRYLRLQMSPNNKALCDYHFFSTFFYNKLKQAVSYKGSDKESSFVKFRRWWKGVNLFQKAYIFIPINDELHWSLVIICIPDKDDISGPIILHLDSLGFHSSKLVFDEIKSYLKQEWHYLKEEPLPDLPISEHIWENLPRRIDEKKIEVPQQKNDSDCGLFVLYFMERFIKEAPERLKKKDLAMFGKRWFRPEEASGLRVKIHDLLLDEFEKASKVNCSVESPSSSSDGASP